MSVKHFFNSSHQKFMFEQSFYLFQLQIIAEHSRRKTGNFKQNDIVFYCVFYLFIFLMTCKSAKTNGQLFKIIIITTGTTGM